MPLRKDGYLSSHVVLDYLPDVGYDFVEVNSKQRTQFWVIEVNDQ